MKRLALLSAVLIVLLAACGSQMEPVDVTGLVQSPAIVKGELSGEPIEGSGESWTIQRGSLYTGAWETSDERLSGDDETVVNCDLSQPSSGEEKYVAECWGTTTLTNDGGTWEGTFQGTSSWSSSEPEHVHDMETVFVGTGDHEGLQFVGTYGGVDFPWELTGTVEPVK
jgi:hypothetical protein